MTTPPDPARPDPARPDAARPDAARAGAAATGGPAPETPAPDRAPAKTAAPGHPAPGNPAPGNPAPGNPAPDRPASGDPARPAAAAAGEPTTGHSARYHPGNAGAAGDGRLFSPVVARNGPPLVAALAPWLAGLTGTALEIGSGTGQHALAFAAAFPRLAWVPSDPDPVHRASIAAWTRHQGARLAPPLALDAGTPWARRPEVQALGPLALVIALNVVHIAPAAVARGIVAGAAARLAPGGYLAFYGPFRQAGRHIGQGNATFDARLRAENPDWGLRDTEEIGALAEAAGLAFAALLAMPANNRLLLFARPCAG